MIAILASNFRERAAFAALCESRRWAWIEFDSVRAFKKFLRTDRPRVVLTRDRLTDGYSDDVLLALAAANQLPATKVLVLLAPAAPSSQHARQVALGADSVHRDPVSADVLVEYLAKYLSLTKSTREKPSPPAADRTIRFAGATIHPFKRRLEHAGKIAHLTPREVQLVERLSESRDEVIAYPTLYSEVLGSRFRGDTSTMRVLLGKLDASFRSVGLTLRSFLEVIPKTGYRCLPTPHPATLLLEKTPRAAAPRAA